MTQQFISHCTTDSIHTRTPLLECAHKWKRSWRRHHNCLGKVEGPTRDTPLRRWLPSVGNHLLIRTEGTTFHEIPHALMQHVLMSIPEMQRFAFRLQAIPASKFERSPNHVEGHRLTPLVIKKPP